MVAMDVTEGITTGVKCVALVDVVLSLVSFTWFVSGTYTHRGNATLANLLVGKDDKLNESDKFAFQIVVTSILIFSAVMITVVRIAADLNLHKAARQVKDDPDRAAKRLGRWRAWGTILVVLLMAEIFTLHVTLAQLWQTLFAITEILFEVAAIIYVGRGADKIQKQGVLRAQGIDIKVLFQL